MTSSRRTSATTWFDWGPDSQLDAVECVGERGGGNKIAGRSVVTRGDAPPMIAAAEDFLNIAPPPVNAPWATGLLGGVAGVGNGGQTASALDPMTRVLVVVSRPGGHGRRQLGRVEHLFDELTVMDRRFPEGWPNLCPEVQINLGAARLQRAQMADGATDALTGNDPQNEQGSRTRATSEGVLQQHGWKKEMKLCRVS